jgi:negative regulator of flagellin synthesis FlgM
MVDRINPTSGDQRINRPGDSGTTPGIEQSRGVGGRGDAVSGDTASARITADQVDISGEAAFRSRALESVREAPDVREDRVRELREAIASGNYNVTSTELAARLLGRRES